MPADTTPALDFLFKPRNIVLFEAKEKLFYFPKGLQKQQFPLDRLFLVSPTEKELFGLKCTKSFEDIPAKTIDLCILAVSRERLLASMKEILAKKTVKFFHIFTAGTSETDELGIQIENEMQQLLRQNPGTHAIGPNCMGVYCPSGHNTYSEFFPTELGHISAVCHSGDLHSKFILYGDIRHKLRLSKGASVGNCLDLQVSDFLTYYNTDPDCDFIYVYFEGFSLLHPREGQQLVSVLRKMEKPVLFLRGGRTIRAQAAAKSHTGALGTSAQIWEGIYRQTHCIEAGTSLDDLIDIAYLFDHFFKRYRHLPETQRLERFPTSKNALVIIWSGGLGVLDTDELTEMGINLPLFDGEVKNNLMKILPVKVGSLSNPLDLPWIAGTDDYIKIVKTAISDKIDVVIVESDSSINWVVELHRKYYQNLLKLKTHLETLNKLLVIILPEYGLPIRQEYYDQLIADGFIVYPSMRRAAKAFLALQIWGMRFKAFRNSKNK